MSVLQSLELAEGQPESHHKRDDKSNDIGSKRRDDK